MDNRGTAATAYLETTVKKMYADDKENVIPCPWVKCKNTLMFDPFRGIVLSHFLKSGFMEGYELVVPVEDDRNENIPDDEWSSLDDDEEGGSIDVHDDHGHDVGPGEDEMGTQSSLATKLDDPYLQELIHKKTTNECAPCREVRKLEQLSID